MTNESDTISRDLATLRRRELQASEDLVRMVRTARRRGLSWATIAGALGVSKQAAWERFGP